MTTPTWQPLVTEPALVRRAEAIIDRTAGLFTTQPTGCVGAAAPRLRHFLDALTGVDGGPAVALLFAYLHQERGDPRAFEATAAWLDHAVDVTAELPEAKPWLYSGVAGCAWTIEHVVPRLTDGAHAEQADPNEDVDAMLTALVAEHAGSIDAELVMGLAGLGTYFLERLPRPSALAGLEGVLAALERRAERSAAGITWRKGPAALSREDRQRYPNGLYNLGIPHGVPGVVAFLARVCRSEASSPRARELLEGSVTWLLAQQRPCGASVYPYVSAPGEGPAEEESRLAWCYGDLGMAVVLLAAARAMNRVDWERQALKLAEGAARRPHDGCRVEDGMFCHGAAGNAHLFNRLYQASGSATLRRAARDWFQRTLDFDDPRNGPTGYACLVRDPPDAPTDEAAIVRAESYGLAVGIVGVALVLLAGIGRVAPDWDRVLATSVEPIRSPIRSGTSEGDHVR